MERDDIEQQLDELMHKREKIERQIRASQDVLSAVDKKIEDFKRRQEARLSSDERVDDEVVRKVVDPNAS